MMSETKKYPAPVTNAETKPFWDAAAQGKFMIKRCTACGEPHYFPRAICPFCFSDKTEGEEASGEATIYTYSLMRKSPTGPYAIAYVTLKEGPSIQTNIVDCDFDTLLIKAKPDGNVCHTGAETCFNEENSGKDFLRNLEKIIEGRKKRPVSGSYTSTLFKEGINRMAQKVGEEAVELVIEAKDNNSKLFLNEAADLMFHYLVLLQAKNKMLDDVIAVLEKRHKE